MQVEEGVAHWKQRVVDEGRDLLGRRAVGVTRKGPVHVEVVDRRRAARLQHGRQVDRRNEDQPAGNLAWVEVADQLAERDRPLILVTVIAALENDGRAIAVPDDGERYADHAPGVVMNGERQV